MYRLQTKSGSWVKIGEDGFFSGTTRKPEEASVFESEPLAQTALDLALAKGLERFNGFFPTGQAPSHIIRHGRSIANPPLSGKALTLAVKLDQIKRASPELFEPLKSLDERADLGSLWAVVSEEGLFAREGATGWTVFTPHFQEASLFESAQAAADFFAAAVPSKSSAAQLASARLLGIGLAPHSSLHPESLGHSFNTASGAMISLVEKRAIEDEIKNPKSAKIKKNGGSL